MRASFFLFVVACALCHTPSLAAIWRRSSSIVPSASDTKRSLISLKGGSRDDSDHDSSGDSTASNPSNVKHVKDIATFNQLVEESADKLMVIDFSATWCMPCKMIAPLYDELSMSNSYNNVMFLKVDVDENVEVTEKFQVASMPTFIFLKNGQVVDRFSGASVEKLKEVLDKLK
jgi:thioredoxin 1